MRSRGFRTAAVSAAALFVVASVMTACGELTGPRSPSTPTDVIATLTTATTATVTWTPSPLNDGVISYTVYRNGNKIGESKTPSFVDSDLVQQTTYVYSVAANCKGGVVSDRSVETEQSTVTTIDATPPTVTSHQPPTNFNGVSSGATATATFSEPMDPSTINTATFNLKVTSTGAAVPGTVTYTAATRVAEFTPAGALPNPTSITATVTTGAKDVAGNGLAAAFTWAFTTRDDTPPAIIATTPSNGATGVSPSQPVTITFSEAMDAATITAANITMRQTSSGANVPGTVTYNSTTHVATFTPSATLAQTTGYTVTVSNSVKDAAGNQMLSNAQFAFTTGDTTSPTVTAVLPLNGALGVALNTTVKVTFSEAMDPASITAATVTLKNAGTSAAVTATVTYDAVTNVATLTPASPLAGNTQYAVTVTTGAKDAAGNPLASAFVSTFTTLNPDTTPPTVVAVSPLNGAIGVATNATVQVTFSEAMDQSTITSGNITLKNTATSAAVTATVSYDVGTNKATLTPSGPLSNGTEYTLTVGTGVKDLAGNPLAAPFVSSFTVVAVADITPPTIVALTPPNGATSQSVATNVVVTFSETMQLATISTATITLKPTAGGSPVAAGVTCNTPCTTATLDPTVNLDYNTSYTVTVTTGVKDLAGNQLAAASVTTFTTELDTTAPTILTPTSPVGGAVNVPVSSVVQVTFSEAMDPTTVNGSTFTLHNDTDNLNVTGTVSYNTTTHVATFTPSSNLLAGKTYTATITTGAKDLAGNPLAFNVSFSFSTVAP